MPAHTNASAHAPKVSLCKRPALGSPPAEHRICGQSTADRAVIAADHSPSPSLRRSSPSPSRRASRAPAPHARHPPAPPHSSSAPDACSSPPNRRFPSADRRPVLLLKQLCSRASESASRSARLLQFFIVLADSVRASSSMAGNARDAVDLFQQFEQIRRERADVTHPPAMSSHCFAAHWNQRSKHLSNLPSSPPLHTAPTPRAAHSTASSIGSSANRAILPAVRRRLPDIAVAAGDCIASAVTRHARRNAPSSSSGSRRLSTCAYRRVRRRQVHAHLTGAQGAEPGQHRQRRFIKDRLERRSSFLQILSSLLFTIKHYTAFSRKLQSLNCKKTRTSRVFIMLMRIFSTIRLPPYPSRKSRCFLPYLVHRTP